jgi:hypothetical protein
MHPATLAEIEVQVIGIESHEYRLYAHQHQGKPGNQNAECHLQAGVACGTRRDNGVHLMSCRALEIPDRKLSSTQSSLTQIDEAIMPNQ